MQKGFFAETLAGRPALWQAMLQANAGQAEADPACAGLPESCAGALVHWLGERPAAVRPAPAGPSGFWDFAEESRRLALLDAPSVHRLCRVTGTALHAPAIAGVVRRDAVLALRAELGEDMYRYALFRGRYELGGVRRFFAVSREPGSRGGVPGRNGALSGPEGAVQAPLGALCAWHGVMALRLVAEGWPEALAEQFDQKLPRLPEPPGVPALPEPGAAGRAEIWRAVKKLLLKEVAPSWAPCFD